MIPLSKAYYIPTFNYETDFFAHNFFSFYVFLADFSYADFDKLCVDFQNPPQDSKIETWWHFTTNAITKEGITADLEAMKEIGYGGAHVFSLLNYDVKDIPDITIGSEQWNDLMRYTGIEAKRLGLRLGAHNCPGWSSSGGKWITPENAMKCLVASELRVQGATDQVLKLRQPKTHEGFYRDIAVLAIKSGATMPTPKLTTDIENPENIIGENDKTSCLPLKEKGMKKTLVFEFDKPFDAKFLELLFDDVGLYVSVDISVSDDGKNYSKITEYNASLYNDNRTPKYIELSQNGTKAKFFKFEFTTAKHFHEWERPLNVNLKNVRLLSERMIQDLDFKNSMAQCIGYVPPSKERALVKGIAKGSVIDITKNFKNGEGKVSLPDGNWIILRVGYTCTGAKNRPTRFCGLECDKLSRRGLNAHWQSYVKKLKADFASAMNYLTIDSYEVGGQNWTDDFAEQFKKRRGYDITQWLPAMLGFVVETEGETAKFLYDVQRTVSDLFAENYYDYYAELCRKEGLKSIVEPYGGLFDFLRCVRNIDIPAGEFWIGKDKPPARMTGSSAHLFGKKKAGAESFTTTTKPGRWLQTPSQHKEYGDRAWISIIIHTYAHQPFMIEGPGLTLSVNGSHMTRLNTWWKLADSWVSYINRSQTMLQRGKYRATVLWLSGESTPNKAWYVVHDDITNAGYDYDYCSADDIADVLKFEEGKIFASENGTHYKMLALGDDCYLSVRTLKAVEKLLESGANVVGIAPLDTPTLSDNPAEFKALVKKLFGNGEKIRKIGKGTLYATSSVSEALHLAGIKPEFKTPVGLRTIGRIDGDIDIRFLANMTNSDVSGEVSFNVGEGKSPYLFDAYNGKISPLAQWKIKDGVVSIPVSIKPYQSQFIVFKKGDNLHITSLEVSENIAKNRGNIEVIDGKLYVKFENTGIAKIELSDGTKYCFAKDTLVNPMDISTDWEVEFQKNRGAPKSAKFPKLESWTKNNNLGIRYFSGIATYTKKIELKQSIFKQNRRIVLSLGKVADVARVKINGKNVATLWHAPFECDITNFVVEGENILSIEIANRWVNRMIGDARLAKSSDIGVPKWIIQKRSNDTDRISFALVKKLWSAADEPLESGLFGPVEIKAVDLVEVCAIKK